ncbi:hypothetical protein MOX02_56150 [Methylobacterium oxalidis]|uniref:General secretion pathway protein GspK n=2 Tax=Methylobacterium oxalidis TaxID=944322 RepID=A0A512JCC4_9HYPH|nr:hypothetical protein MOX02_56150 [Methylobacterium oxalidis]GLS64445.1 hypothetical protein GCM10007888_28260 [Methylobacterium oxalidis]
MIGLIGLMLVTYIAAARYRAIEARAAAQIARAEAGAEGAVNLAILDLLADLPKGESMGARFGSGGRPRLCALEDGTILAVAVANESGKVDLNGATPDLVAALIRGVAPEARAAVRSLLRLREAAQNAKDQAQTQQNQTPQAQAGQLQAGQVRQSQESRETPAFRSAVELARVPGVDRALFETLLPMVTTHTGSPGLNAQVAATATLLAVTGARSRAEAERANAAFFLAQAPGRVFLIRGEAVTRTGARVAREAVVEFTPGPPVAYSIREWREGGPQAPLAPAGSGGGAPC